ncbi:hypothetical protein V7S43_018569 [Phytophthora oleae]|uniref:M96 mating-specific protein family n=1 Tax=Phytophthora oleae TaxID=2107226 RepID=A0ABD3ER06_9STRA
MADKFDENAFDAALSFMEEYAAESLGSTNIPVPLSSSPAPFSASTLRLSGAEPSELYVPVMGPSPTFAKTPALVPLPIASHTNYATQATAKKKPRKPQANPNRVRNELRFELAFLREKSAQLEQELSSLRQQSQSVAGCAKSPTLVVPHRGSTLELEAWKGIATRQRKRRDDSKRENSRLRVTVEKQRKLAVSLADLLRKRVAECAYIKDPTAQEYRLSRDLDFHSDIGVFRDLFQHLEAAYDEVDNVLTANGLATMEIPTNDVHIREGVDGKYLEFFANKIVPFGLCETAEAAWDHFKGVEKHCGNGGLYEKAAKNLDQSYTILEDFTKELFSNNSRADMKVQQIVRRYIEAKRDLVVFASRVSPIEIRHKAIEGMTNYHLRGYVVTKPSPLSSPGHELTMLQFCSRISIDKEPGTIYDHDHVRAVVRFLIGNTVGNIRCYQEKIENSLVDRALHGNKLVFM